MTIEGRIEDLKETIVGDKFLKGRGDDAIIGILKNREVSA